MVRTSFAALALVTFATIAAGCAHRADSSSTTTVTSGSTSGVRVTGARVEHDDAANRLADELCGRAAACKAIGPDARWRTEESCMADQSVKASSQISRWTCTPTQTQAGFEGCLAAIRSEKCETDMTRAEQLGACRSVAVCGR